ncbi:helix-turn-helix transcriptional regulator [Aeoliella straminimaris]|uniref:helix-turn-helix transcriptional regulator n=1 Tax=Aeoliella straminimaris TaxID=2954799 RepID=UPI003CC52A10
MSQAKEVDLSCLQLLDITQLAELCGCSCSTLRRLADRGAMPAPVKIGVLSRWRKNDVEKWITGGCPIHQQWGGRAK